MSDLEIPSEENSKALFLQDAQYKMQTGNLDYIDALRGIAALKVLRCVDNSITKYSQCFLRSGAARTGLFLLVPIWHFDPNLFLQILHITLLKGDKGFDGNVN